MRMRFGRFWGEVRVVSECNTIRVTPLLFVIRFVGLLFCHGGYALGIAIISAGRPSPADALVGVSANW